MSAETIRSILDFGNLILSSANVIIGFSLFVYILTHNYRSPVARAFCALVAFVTVVYVVDVSMNEVSSAEAADLWLRLQWVGIAFVPAAYFQFSDALLRSTGQDSRGRRIVVAGSYLLGLGAFVLAATSDLVVGGVDLTEHIYHLVAGPLFWVFALYYVVTSLSGWINIRRARNSCLTTTSRRRMAYLTLAFAAPSVGAFPYLLIPTAAERLAVTFVSLLTLIGNLGIALMTIVIAYIVAYQGVLLPDRVVKHRLIHYLLRGPLVAILVIMIMLAVPRVEQIWGLPRDTILIIAVAGSTVTLQVLINLAKPALDRVIYSRDREEITWIQTLDQRLLTTTDLEQLLENTVIALCDLLHSPSSFIVAMEGSSLSLKVVCGSEEAATAFLSKASLPSILSALSKSRRGESVSNQDFALADGHWLLPLHGRSDQITLGILGIRATTPSVRFSAQDLETVYGLVHRAELALEDMRLQQLIFAVLQGLDSELDQIQEWRSNPLYGDDRALRHLEMSPIHLPGFVQAAKDALSQFWGGPKLSRSDLLRMRIVRERLIENDNVPAKAVRAVLQEAIERLKPAGERNLTSNEWVIYNILDLKFVQGYKTRDIARRLAMSESDFYRKQRVAISQVADTLIQMERADTE